jgi:hypothetical protein
MMGNDFCGTRPSLRSLGFSGAIQGKLFVGYLRWAKKRRRVIDYLLRRVWKIHISTFYYDIVKP